MGQRVLGLDLGIQAPSVGVVADDRGNIVGSAKKFELAVEELERLEESALQGEPLGTKLYVVMERTFPTSEYVSGYFTTRGHSVSFAKPDQVKAFRKCLSPKVKTDERDAYVLARLPSLDPKQYQRVHVPATALRSLKMLVSQRASMVRQLVELKNQLIAYANAVWPGITRIFVDLDSDHARRFLREQTPEAVQSAPLQELTAFLNLRGRLRATYAERLAKRLQALAQRCMKLHQLVADEELELQRNYTLELIEMIEVFEERIRTKERQSQKTYEQVAPERYLDSIPGIGDKTAPTLFAYFGEPARFPSTRRAQGFVGLFPETDASGGTDRKGTRITKQGPSLLRRDLFLVADHFRRIDPQGARLYHDQMVHKGKHHTSALCVVANRMVIPRILAVLHAQRPYVLRDFDGNTLTLSEARELAAEWQIPTAVRQRLRSKKQQSREDYAPQVTSQPKASRNGRIPRLEDASTLPDLSQQQLETLLVKGLAQLWNSSGNLEEILTLVQQEGAKSSEKKA